jgi:alcohol dehydrogenase class IV
MSDFSCQMPNILFGEGKLQELGSLATGIGKKAFVAIDPYLVKTGLSDRITSLLHEASIGSTLFSEIEPDPDCFSVDKAAEISKKNNCDFILAVGGGSAIDFGKGVAVISGNPGTCWRYTRRKDHTAMTPGEGTLPVIAVPTTAGTGSEATHFAVFSNPELKEKSTIAHIRIIPRIAIVDPVLTYSMPPMLTALTGIDVLAHAIESYINIKATPFSKLVGLEAIRIVGKYLTKAVSNGGNTQARAHMAWSSALAGIAIAHANPTLPHALGQAAGGFVHAPHGASVAACLSEVLKISYAADVESFAEIAEALDGSVRDLPLYVKAAKSVEIVDRLLRDIGCTVKLGDFGMKEEDIERITQIACTAYATGIGLHPKVVSEEEIKQIYLACL